jgi:transcriptional regulator with XRE-family HTH domain
MSRPHDTPATHVGELIDRGLRATGLSNQDKLAEICGVSASYIVKLKKGRIRNPNDEVLDRLAQTLGQRLGQYQAALFADQGRLPAVARTIEIQEGVHLTPETEHELNELVRKFIKQHRNHEDSR